MFAKLKLFGRKKHTDKNSKTEHVDGSSQALIDNKTKPLSSSSEPDEEDDNDNDDVVDELPDFEPDHTGRHSVSAEAYGEWNKKQDFKAPVHPKTPEQEARIRSILMQSFMFQHLEEADLKTVLLAFTEKNLKPGEVLIKQGDDGDSLYLIESGDVDVFKLMPGETESRHMCVMSPGDAVGELALLYNVPRAATVMAKGDVVLWALDRASFNCIVKDSAAKRRELYEHVLKEVKIFESMDPYERDKLSDALKTEFFEPGTIIISEGDVGDKFFIIEIGQAQAIKNGQVVLEYGRGDYFGELALIRNEPRAATVKAKEGETVKCITLDRRSFKRLLGPIEDILKRQAGRYEEIEARLVAAGRHITV